MALSTSKFRRSALANHKRNLPKIDGRSRTARRFGEIFEHYMAAAPGQEHLARVAASLILQN
jgi:hypothetical protein